MDLASAKVIGAGLAAIGVGAAAAGVGYVFGSFLQSALRNPAAADGQQGRVFVFLRRMTPTVAAGITVPLSLAGTCAVMWLLGFSINNLSLMAFAIAMIILYAI